MAANDDFYKREEDRKWRERTDERIINLQAGQVTQNDRLDAISDQIAELKELLEGSPKDRKDTGLKGDLTELEDRVDRLWSATFVNTSDRTVKEDSREHRWEINRTSLTAIVVAVISTLGLALKGCDVKNWFRKERPAEYLERLDREEADLKTKRGPEIKKRLAEIQKERERYMGPASKVWE